MEDKFAVLVHSMRKGRAVELAHLDRTIGLLMQEELDRAYLQVG